MLCKKLKKIERDKKSAAKAALGKKELKTDKKGFITKCPNYNRIKEKAVAIEIKNLDYNCLKREYLDKIIEVIEKNKTETISNQQ